MKKIFAFVILCLLYSYLIAFEGGGLFSSSFSFDIGTPKKTGNPSFFYNVNKLSLWAEQNLDKEAFYNFSVQGSAYVKIRKLLSPNGKRAIAKFILDIDLLKFSFFIPINKNSNLSLDIGRRGVIDSTGVILSQYLDGLFLQYKSPHFSFLASFASTYLLNAHTVALNEKDYKVSKYIYALPKSYIGMMTLFHLPILKSSYSIDIDTINFFETKKNGNIKLYVTTAIQGPIIKRLFFSTSLSGSFVREEAKWNSGILLIGAIAYYFNKYNAKLGLSMQYAQGGKMSFQPFTMKHISSQFFSPYTNVWNTGIKASLKPVPELYISTLFNIVCNATKSEGTPFYRGIEWLTSANYTIKKDINIEVSFGQFIHKNTYMNTFLTLKGMISF